MLGLRGKKLRILFALVGYIFSPRFVPTILIGSAFSLDDAFLLARDLVRPEGQKSVFLVLSARIVAMDPRMYLQQMLAQAERDGMLHFVLIMIYLCSLR